VPPTAAPKTIPSQTSTPQTVSQNDAPQAAAVATKATSGPVKIFVGNLSFRVTALDLEFVFQQFGKLVSSEVKYDENDKSRGFGFIEVENEDIATTLLDFMQGADVDRRPVRLERVGDRPKSSRPYYDKNPYKRRDDGPLRAAPSEQAKPKEKDTNNTYNNNNNNNSNNNNKSNQNNKATANKAKTSSKQLGCGM